MAIHPESEARAQSYAERAAKFALEAERLDSRSGLVSNLRGLSFSVFAFGLGFALLSSYAIVAAPVSAVALVAFVVLIVAHSRVLEARDSAARWQLVNERGAKRCRGEWRALIETGAELREGKPPHAYAEDLDVFGEGSLFQRINVAHTRFGQDCLERYLAEMPSLEVARERQQAVRLLVAQQDFRQQLEALSLALVPERSLGANLSGSSRHKATSQPPDPEPLLRWAESEPRLSKSGALKALAWLLPVVNLATLALVAWGPLPGFALLPAFLVSLIVVLRTGGEAGRVFTAVSATEGAFLRYAPMLQLLEEMTLEAELVARLRERILSGERKPSLAMTEFQRGVGWFDLRHNGLLHPVLNVALLWDLHCVLRLERWQARAGKAVRGWFHALGELEALSSFAGYAADEPHCCWPELDDAGVFVAQQLGHPLIEPGSRVNNDVSLEQRGTALLVTGSNMSGKSTLMRSMGLAILMARAGGPVCASAIRLGELTLRTSIRVSDSLGSGVSHFYAEVRKLKSVLDATEQVESGCVFFLLDEVLHGTNSRERQVGARWVLAELLRRGAAGAVSTHDMGLCELTPELMQRVRQVHLRESVEGQKMTFDYRLREGPVTSGNALRLMQLVGIPVPLDD
ncbi:MAG: DNA mismatch repair protein MutS [Polyangiaceae bacterium]